MSATGRYFWLLGAWIFFVIVLSLLPLPMKSSLRTHGRFHHSAHFVSFLITACVIGWHKRTPAWIALGCLAAIALGLSLEIAQVIVYGNFFEWDDLAVDSLGALAGAALLSYRARIQSRGKKVICHPAVKS